ncbi:MAG: zinc ribbon domain-containing protein [Chloroflexi bacterium]|nr:zinc ribbon domain-containing protein [Chloroflexota bacterium]
MPIYDYVCTQCSARFDALVKLSSNSAQTDTAVCPKCGGCANKVVSRFAIAGAAGSAADDELPAPMHPKVTPKEDIERWRKESGKK